MKTIPILNNQSLIDIALQHRGTATAAFEIAVANELSLTDDLTVGKIQVIPETLYANRDIADYYRSKGLLPATAVTDNFIEEIYDPGIGEMIIEKTFIIR